MILCTISKQSFYLIYFIILIILPFSRVACIHLPNARNVVQTTWTKAKDFRLPTNLKPILYQIEMEPIFKTNTFRGSINISFCVKTPTKQVVLHQRDLKIDSTKIILLDQRGNKVNKFVKATYSRNNKHFYTIYFAKLMAKGMVYTLVMCSFNGELKENNRGFYLAKYLDAKGLPRKLALTQFEATDARSAFPCFDEPSLKAEFEISLIRSPPYHSLSNMPKVSEHKLANGRVLDKFARTVKMSPYLVAFIVSDYKHISQNNHRVFARPAYIAHKKLNFALKDGINILNAMSQHLGVPYVIDKMDQVAIPSDYFAAVAMENWGLVTYAEYALVTNEGLDNKQDIITTMAHEFAHQWFGNLVTPVWWNCLWLSEGFATYFQYHIPGELYGDYHLKEKFVVYVLQTSLDVESVRNVPPINQDGGSPQDIEKIEVRAYEKPASIIRMVEGTLSSDVFTAGIRMYLNKMKYKVAKPIDLYLSWQEALDKRDMKVFAAGENVSSFMKTWVTTSGYPLITVRRHYNKSTAMIIQNKFIQVDPINNDTTYWQIPITYTTENAINFKVRTPKVWLTTKQKTIVLQNVHRKHWLIVNIQQYGFYRVNYDKDNWLRIINYLETKHFYKIHPMNRAQLLDDCYWLTEAKLVAPKHYAQLLNYIKHETDYFPLYVFIKSLANIETYIANTPHYNNFKGKVLSLLKNAIESVGFQEQKKDTISTRDKRDLMIVVACAYGRKDCREHALKKVKQWNDEGSKDISLLGHPLLCAGLRTASQADWEAVFNKYKTEKEPQIRESFLDVLGCSERERIVDRYINAALSKQRKIRDSERVIALISIWTGGSYGSYGRNHLYKYIHKNWKKIGESLDDEDLRMLFETIAKHLSTRKQYSEMETLLDRLKVSKTLQEDVLSVIKVSIDRAERMLPALISWVSKTPKH